MIDYSIDYDGDYLQSLIHTHAKSSYGYGSISIDGIGFFYQLLQ